MDHPNRPATSRRNAIKVMIGLSTQLVFPAPFVVTPSRTASKRIYVRDAGGVVAQVYADVFYKSFTRATGIEVIGVSAEPEPTAQVRMMVETRRYLWDIAALSDRAVQFLTTGSVYVEQHGLEHDPVIASIPPQFISPYGVGAYVYATLLAYRTDAFKGRPAPASWQDLWDIHRFAGRRSLYKHPTDTVEVALMADGVPPKQIYPCDLDRAFRRLDTIKPHVAVWWTSGPQTEHLLQSGEIDLAAVWSGRAKSAMDAGAPVAISWEQHLYKCMCWAILKGTPNADACRQFIRFASDPKRQALLAPYAFGPTQPGAFSLIDPRYKRFLPSYPDNLKSGLHVDAAYWISHQATATQRFNEWQLA